MSTLVQDKLNELKTRLIEVSDIQSATAVLGWDQSTYMPPASAPTRGRQMATLSRIAHEKFTDKTIGNLLDSLELSLKDTPYDSDDAALLRKTRHDYDIATKVPSDFLAMVNEHGSESYMAWTEARPANDFARMQPYLEKTLEYSRQMADFFPGYDHIADPLIAFSDFGMKAETIRVLFAALREQIVPLVHAIASAPQVDDSCLWKTYPGDKQLAFALEVAKDFGYDLQRGRQDLTHHPYMTRFSTGDIRITTRVKENYLGETLFSTLHETGHALYELGINPEYDATPLGGGVSAGVHESQSRLWENVVGRSRGFWQHYYPKLQATFPDQLGAIDEETFYRAVNKVAPSLIRTDADEVTYNLHVMIRFDLELELLEGKLAIRDLPAAWNARYQSDLGITPPDDRDGILQDVHWYGGLIGGAFQGYTLGNILNAQYYNAALKAHPEIPSEIAHGRFATLHNWLRDNIYQYGSKFTTEELTARVTGGSLDIMPLVTYLRTKYGEIYRV